MRKLVEFLLLVAFLVIVPIKVAYSKTITIAVIDTGIDKISSTHLCKFGHKSFVEDDPYPLVDRVGHGTHIAGIISANAGKSGYCLVAIKFYSETATGDQNLAAMKKAITYAININVGFINISGGGEIPNNGEFTVVERALNKHIVFVAAAGNEHSNLDAECNYFPACYDPRIIMVGNLIGYSFDNPMFSTLISPTSNYGNRITRWEVGTNVLSTLPGGKHGYMTGTSQATAVATGKLVGQALGR